MRWYSILIIAVCALITAGSRFFPFVFIKHGKVPEILQYLGKILPLGIMTILVIYCIKDISFLSYSSWVPYVSAIALTALLHLLFKNTFISIAGGTALYMIMVQLIFV